MSFEWKEHRLGDITRWASGGTPSKQNPDYWGGCIPWISASSMKSKICADSDERITEEAVRSGARMCDPGTILLLVRGSELHKRIPIGVATKRVAYNQDVKAITTCSEDLSGDYLYYLLKGNEDFLLNSVEFTGIGAGKLETPFLQDLVFPIPTRQEQKVITDFMITLDDKIELNRKTNETLEAMAKALFKSWFVDFDPVRAKVEGRPTGLPDEISDLFPDSFEDSELGEIPSGWRTGSLDEIALNPRDTAKPGEMDSTDRYIGLEHMPRGSICLGESGEAEELESNKNRFREGDILYGKLRPYFKKTGYAQFDGVCSTDIVVTRKKGDSGTGFICCLLASEPFIDFTVAASTGTRMPRTSWGDMCEFPIAIPTPRLLKGFDLQFYPLIERIKMSCEYSVRLSSMRDALLPKLISGEIRIPDAERMLEEVSV